jgi:hypothetical protein
MNPKKLIELEEYIKWLEDKIEVYLEDKDLQRGELWAFCQALKKYRELALPNPPVIGSVNLTQNQIGELSDIGRQYIYLDENDEGRLSHGGVVEIIKRYEELRAPDVVGRFNNQKT